MTNKIIEAARQAEAYATSQTIDIVDWKAIAQERFYAIARAEALDDAAKAVKSLTAEIRFQAIEHYKFADAAEKTILALKEQDAAIAAGKGEG